MAVLKAWRRHVFFSSFIELTLETYCGPTPINPDRVGNAHDLYPDTDSDLYQPSLMLVKQDFAGPKNKRFTASRSAAVTKAAKCHANHTQG